MYAYMCVCVCVCVRLVLFLDHYVCIYIEREMLDTVILSVEHPSVFDVILLINHWILFYLTIINLGIS